MNLELWKKTKKERGMTYKDISERSGIPVGTLKNIFAGYTPDPRQSTIKAIELALGVETHVFRETNALYLSDDEKELIETVRGFSKSEQTQIFNYVKFLAKEKK
ncbi:MAG: helix-turn-helix transcriptional regulator [Clostridia bacterium]|nr:helix-turn-helix transcriptional regulator [Clostridia bacterium]